MIVDACTRVWQGAEAWAIQTGVTPAGSAELSAAMDGVDAAFVLGYRCDRMGAHVPAERVAAWVEQAPERRIGFAGIDPTGAGVIDDLEAARGLGLLGVTMAPADCDCRPTDHRCEIVLEWCARAQVPVVISNPGLLTPWSVLEFGRPALFDDALRALPDLRIVFGDIGRAYADEAIAMIAKHAHAYLELSTVARRSGAMYHTLSSAHELGVLPKVLFGSGFPAERPQKALSRLFGLSGFATDPSPWSAIPRESLRAMVERDILPLLGLESWPPLGAGRTSQPDRLHTWPRTLEKGRTA